MIEAKEAIDTLIEGNALPLKQWENDEFAQQLFQAERLLESLGVTDQMTEWLISKELHKRAFTAVSVTDSDSVRTARWHLDETLKIDQFLSRKAHELGLDEEVKEALGIPAFDEQPSPFLGHGI